MRTLFSSLVVSAALSVAAPVAAQSVPVPRPERLYRGLFGGDTGKAGELLTLSGSFGGGYDDNIFASGQTPATSGQAGSTTFLTGSGQLGYSVSKSKLAFSASGGGGIGYYPGLGDPTIAHFAGGVSVSRQLASHASLSFSQTETYQPFYFWSWLPHDVMPVEATPVFDPGSMTIVDAVQAASLSDTRSIVADAVVGQQAEYYLASSTGVGYTQGLSERTTLSMGYNYRRSDSKSGVQDYTASGFGGTLGYVLGKGVSLKAGYSYSTNDYPYPDGHHVRYQGHTIDGGVGYNKALSFSRRTTLSFQTGFTGINDGNQTHYGVIGNVNLTREIGRDWSAGVSYSRNVSYIETFRAPVLSDSLTTGVGGLLSRSIQFQASAGVSRGSVGYDLSNTYESYFASVGTRFAISRRAGLSVYYAYYRYSFEDGIVLPPGVGRFTNREAVGFTFDTWVPLIQRNRSN